MTHDRAYLEETITIVRNYRVLDKICWIKWVNDLADEVERLWAVTDQPEATEEYGQDVEAEPERLKPLFDRQSVFTDDTGWCPPYGRRTGA